MAARRRRRIRLLVLIPLGIVIGWYAVSRVASPWTAVSVEAVGDAAAAADAFAYPIRIAAYNVAHGRGGGLGASNWDGGPATARERRLRAIGALLTEHDVDVAVLNEVDFSAVWSGHDDQAAVIADAGGYAFVARQRNIDLAVPLASVRYGNAVLSRYPITGAELIRLPPHSRLEAIMAGRKDSLLTRIALPDDTTIAVWALHLEHRSEPTRVLAAVRLLELAPTVSEPLFLVGDFNSTPRTFPLAEPVAAGHTALDLLAAADRFTPFPAVEAPSVLSFPSSEPDRIIDWVFVPTSWRIDDGFVPAAPHSDHLPVIVSVAPRGE